MKKIKWEPIETAPKDGTRFIGLMEDGLVFLTNWQEYHTYTTKEEQASKGRMNGFHPARMRGGWSYEDDSSHNPCTSSLIGWISQDTTIRRPRMKKPAGTKRVSAKQQMLQMAISLRDKFNCNVSISVEARICLKDNKKDLPEFCIYVEVLHNFGISCFCYVKDWKDLCEEFNKLMDINLKKEKKHKEGEQDATICCNEERP